MFVFAVEERQGLDFEIEGHLVEEYDVWNAGTVPFDHFLMMAFAL